MSGNPWGDNTHDYPVRLMTSKSKGEDCKTRKDGIIVVDWCNMMLRLHNGCRDGGAAYVPLISLCPDENGVLPTPTPAVVMPPVPIPDGTITTPIQHNLGYVPVVQALDANNSVIQDAIIMHNDNNTVTVAPADGGTPIANVIIR